MKAPTPPKHKTPNWKLVRHTRETEDFIGRPRTIIWWRWEAQSLRADRKDL